MTEKEAAQETPSSNVPLLPDRRQQAAATLVQLFRPDQAKSNRIRTNKYTWYSFVPLNLFEQFSQLGNAYFLLVATLQMIPAISNTDGRPLTLFPLSFVILMGGIKDFFEDLQRFLSDRRENLGEAVVVDEELNQTTVHWEDIHPGMVLLIHEGERVPVDALVLATDLPDGECFVETANLDGESNLKKKVAATTPCEWRAMRSRSNEEESPGLSVEVESPSVDLYRFNGALMTGNNAEPRGIHIGNVLLRGTSLQRTGQVYCLALYCGCETRAMQNSKAARFKASKLDVELNRVVLAIFALQFFVCSTLSICALVWCHTFTHGTWYLEMPETASSTIVALLLRRAGTWLLQSNNMVPVSLMVTLTCVKFVQGVFISWDRLCGDVDRGKPARVNASQVIESLGQITHVFSDKTGTLTQNVMEYKACSVCNRVYGLEEEEHEEGFAEPKAVVRMPHVHFCAETFNRDLAATEDVGRSASLASFLLCQAICHSVEVEGGEGANLRGSRASLLGTAPLYNGSSPDELALVYMAHSMGLEFVRMSEGRAIVRVTDRVLAQALEAAIGGPGSHGSHGLSLAIDVLDVCDFDNDRKRSSMVVRYPDGRLMLLLKGADTTVLPYVSGELDTVEDHLTLFAQRGLRTLCLAQRQLTEDEYREWHAQYVQAQAVVCSSERATQVAALASQLETHLPLSLLGATAIEDKLQENVPETIEQLRLAGISVWVLTGDKVETAISIARSCKLLTETMVNVVIEDTSPAEVEKDLQYALQCPSLALTIAGAALSVILATPEHRKLFLQAAVRCRAVVCCRVSPKQKADVVELVKMHKADATTLSIGDGANDVSMIVAAHVGVGISGKEGAQAAYTADFAISEFKYLRRLLFVHGRESYRRSSVVILYNFYKNILLVAPTMLYAPVSGFTGLNVFFPWLNQLYNIFYTHTTVCLYGILDRAAVDLDDLEVKYEGYGPRLFSRIRAGTWIFTAVLQGLVINFMSDHGLDGGWISEVSPGLADLRTNGYLRFIWVVLCANILMALRQSCWHAVMWPLYAINIGCAFASVWFFDRGIMMGLVGANMPRILLATLLVLIVNIYLGETIIRRSADIEAFLRRARTRCGRGVFFEPAARDVPLQQPSEAQRAARCTGLTVVAHGLSALGVEVELSATSSGSAAQESATPVEPTLPTRPRASLQSLMMGSRNSQRFSSFGFAFSQECQLERASVASQPKEKTVPMNVDLLEPPQSYP